MNQSQERGQSFTSTLEVRLSVLPLDFRLYRRHSTKNRWWRAARPRSFRVSVWLAASRLRVSHNPQFYSTSLQLLFVMKAATPQEMFPTVCKVMWYQRALCAWKGKTLQGDRKISPSSFIDVIQIILTANLATHLASRNLPLSLCRVEKFVNFCWPGKKFLVASRRTVIVKPD